MRLLTFHHDRELRLGVKLPGGILDVIAAAGHLADVPVTVDASARRGRRRPDRAERFASGPHEGLPAG